MKRLYCPVCDNTFNEDVLMQSKFDKDVYKCPGCGSTDDELIEVLTCTDCGKEMIVDDLINFEGQYFCEACFNEEPPTYYTGKYKCEFISRQVLGYQSYITLPNGLEVSVITGYGSFTDKENPYEIAVFENGRLTYSYTDGDVVGGQTKEDVDNWLEKLSKVEK